MKLQVKIVKAILFKHQVPYREIGDWVQVQEVLIVAGAHLKVWVPCPDTRKELMQWIGV